MRLENEFGEKIHLADNLTLKEIVDMGLVVVLADNEDTSESCWVPINENIKQHD